MFQGIRFRTLLEPSEILTLGVAFSQVAVAVVNLVARLCSNANATAKVLDFLEIYEQPNNTPVVLVKVDKEQRHVLPVNVHRVFPWVLRKDDPFTLQ